MEQDADLLQEKATRMMEEGLAAKKKRHTAQKHEIEKVRQKWHLHSQGETWWHFRKMDSLPFSFTVTLIQDGTVVLSGDIGTLAFRRTYSPLSRDALIGFPSKDDHPGYFAQKVVATDNQNGWVREWAHDHALEDLKADLLERYMDSPEALTKMVDLIEEGLFDTFPELIDLLEDTFPSGDWYEWNFGWDWHPQFLWQFAALKFWSNTVTAARKEMVS